MAAIFSPPLESQSADGVAGQIAAHHSNLILLIIVH